MKTNIYDFVSKDVYRPIMTGVFHDNGVAVASNLMVMLVSKEDYDENLNGEVISKSGEHIHQKNGYPKWQNCIPKKSTNFYDKVFPMDALRNVVERAKKYLKAAPKFTELCGKRKRVHRDAIVLVQCDGFLMGFKYENAKIFCSLPSDGEVVSCEDDRRPLIYRNEKHGYDAFLMPVAISSDADMVKVALAEGICNWQDNAGLDFSMVTFA